MRTPPDAQIAAIDAHLTATIDRFSAIEDEKRTVDDGLRFLFGCASSLSLISDLPLGQDAHGYGVLGRTGTALMRITESLVGLLTTERENAREALTRARSDRKVIASLLGLSVLLNAMLAFVALR